MSAYSLQQLKEETKDEVSTRRGINMQDTRFAADYIAVIASPFSVLICTIYAIVRLLENTRAAENLLDMTIRITVSQTLSLSLSLSFLSHTYTLHHLIFFASEAFPPSPRYFPYYVLHSSLFLQSLVIGGLLVAAFGVAGGLGISAAHKWITYGIGTLVCSCQI